MDELRSLNPKTTGSRLRHLLVMFAITIAGIVVNGATTPAAAQEGTPEGFRSDGFEPVASQHSGLLNLRRPDVLDHMVPSIGVFGHYSHAPIEASDVKVTDPAPRTVDRRITTEVGAALGLFDLVQISALVPVVPYQTGDGLDEVGSTGLLRGAGLADGRAALDVVVVKPEWTGGFGVAAAGVVHLPNYNRADFLSDGAYRVEPNLALSYEWERGHEIVANASVPAGSPAQARGYHYSDAASLKGGLGGVYHIGGTSLDLIGSLFGSNSLQPFVLSPSGRAVDNSARLLEFAGGIRLDLPGKFRIQAGGGVGLTDGVDAIDGVGVPDFRAFTSVHWINKPDRLRSEAERGSYAPKSPEVDSDNDGVPDSVDECPDQPETPNGVLDEDGCPDKDTDGDGVADSRDDCPETPGAKDYHGCPPPDSDDDGIPDHRDECPNVRGTPERDGCPAPDADGDGIPDHRDECPDEPEDMDGYEDDDGCPEPGSRSEAAPEAEVGAGKIEISQRIQFATGEATIRSESHAVLDEIARLLQKHEQILEVRIEGHTDSSGPRSVNQRLSRERAQSVKQYLVDQGIDSSRLTAVGRGESEPVASNDTEAGREKNRRVEFVIDKVE